jgi:hypothetical protein
LLTSQSQKQQLQAIQAVCRAEWAWTINQLEIGHCQLSNTESLILYGEAF